MVPKLCLALLCFTLGVLVVCGAPRLTERRSPRSIDKSAALHARLRLLHKQIHDLVAEEERRKARGREGEEEQEAEEETENEISNQLRDISRLRGGTESQMTSQRQKQELADTLDQLLRESLPKRNGADRTNTAGEYLSDKFNKGRMEDEDGEQAISKELQSEAGLSRRPKQEQKEEDEEEQEEEEEEEETEEEEKKRLESIYDMLVKLYNQKHHQNWRGGEQREEEEKEEEEEEPAKRRESSMSPRRPADGAASSHSASQPDFLADEGTFGDFVDTEEERRPSAGDVQYRKELRKSVLSAIESRLLQDLRDARDVGISVDDIIDDVEGKVMKEEHLRHIESELDRLSRRG